ncbi:MAG: hypothetical protein HC908_02775 [Calothrix sp. SM1_7_51]|nr:hypothetical protein [Calothrix sp. SM1_7_51]
MSINPAFPVSRLSGKVLVVIFALFRNSSESVRMRITPASPELAVSLSIPEFLEIKIRLAVMSIVPALPVLFSNRFPLLPSTKLCCY